MKNPIIHENMSKIRSKSTDTIIKQEIALNLLEDLFNTVYSSQDIFFCKRPDTKS